MPIDRNPTISIVVPVYNRVEIIGRTISSVLSQAYQNFELIIVDDGSTDDVKLIVSRYSDERIKFFRLEENAGVSTARNHGLHHSTGKAIVFLDSDDELHSEYLKKMSDSLFRFDKDIVICRAEYSNGMTLPTPSHMSAFLMATNKIDYLLMGNIIPMPCLLFSEKVRNRLTFDENILSYEDFDLILNVLREYNDVNVLSDILVYVNDTPGSVNKNIPAIYSGLKSIQKKFASQLTANRKVEFYFKKNMFSICRSIIHPQRALLFLLNLATYREFYSRGLRCFFKLTYRKAKRRLSIK